MINNNNSATLFPNPANNLVYLKLEIVQRSDVVIRVYNITGSCIIDKVMGNMEGEKIISLNTAMLSKGLYLVRILINDKQITKKLMIQE